MRLTIEHVRALLAAATPGPIDVHRCDADGGAIDYQLQRGPGTGGAVLGYATDHDGSPRAKADAALWSHAPDLAADLLDAHAAIATDRERAEAAVADRDYWRDQATAAAPSVDGMRALGTRLLPGGTGCVVDPERVVVAVDALRAQVRRSDDECQRATLRAQVKASACGVAESEAAALRWALSAIAEGVAPPCLADRERAPECTAEEPCLACSAGDRIAGAVAAETERCATLCRCVRPTTGGGL